MTSVQESFNRYSYKAVLRLCAGDGMFNWRLTPWLRPAVDSEKNC